MCVVVGVGNKQRETQESLKLILEEWYYAGVIGLSHFAKSICTATQSIHKKMLENCRKFQEISIKSHSTRTMTS